MPITSVNEVKIMLQVSGSSYDEQIKALLPAVTDFIEAFCFTGFDKEPPQYNFYGNNPGLFPISDAYLYQTVQEKDYPHGLKLAAAQMVEYLMYKQKNANISSETIGAYSVAYSNASAYPPDIIEMLKPYRKVKFS